MKIAYFIDRLIRGGTELQLVEQIYRLAEKGVKQELFCLFKSQEHDSINIKCKVHILGIRRLISTSCLIKLVSLRKYLKTNSFNIVQTYFFDSTVVGVLAGKLAGGLKIISCRRDLGFWYTPKLLFFLRLINRTTDKILVNSNAVKESVSKNELVHADKIDILPNGIDILDFEYPSEERRRNRAELGILPGQICVGTVTNMSRKVKRVDLFIKAAAWVIKRINDIHFLVQGEGKLKSELIRMTQDLGVDKQITFLGRNISKHKALSAMDIGVLTSDSEGFSNAIMEYMAVGLPVIATAVGGNIDLVVNEKNGLLTVPGDYEQIGERILLLATDRQKRLKLGKQGRQLVSEHGWDHVAGRIFKYYQEQLNYEI